MFHYTRKQISNIMFNVNWLIKVYICLAFPCSKHVLQLTFPQILFPWFYQNFLYLLQQRTMFLSFTTELPAKDENTETAVRTLYSKLFSFLAKSLVSQKSSNGWHFFIKPLPISSLFIFYSVFIVRLYKTNQLISVFVIFSIFWKIDN